MPMTVSLVLFQLLYFAKAKPAMNDDHNTLISGGKTISFPDLSSAKLADGEKYSTKKENEDHEENFNKWQLIEMIDINGNKKGNNYDVNKVKKYIATAYVIDHSFYNLMGKDVNKISKFVNNLSNFVNMIYEPQGFKVVILKLFIWSSRDEIDTSKGHQIVHNFQRYNKEKLLDEFGWRHDYAQLLTHKDIGLAGKSLQSSLCRGDSSGVVYAWNTDPRLLAGTVAHELGHSIGLNHYGARCNCATKEPCLMYPYNNYKGVTDMADCTKKDLKDICKRGFCTCLLDYPRTIFNKPTCGNGYIEDGEECDCGYNTTCNNRCCDATTCKLKANAECAHGDCCSNDCKLLKANTMCRAKKSSCDIEEYCSGTDAHCPLDVGVEDFTSCNGDKGYCLKTVCTPTLDDQCKWLWGEGAVYGDKDCYVDGKPYNVVGDRFGNCGQKSENEYIPCTMSDNRCGKLLCYGNSLSTFVKIGFGKITKKIFKSPKKCRSGITHLVDAPDPTFPLTGTKCGDKKVCVNHKCVPVKDQIEISRHSCHRNCQNGVCTERGICRCNPGYGGADCSLKDKTNVVGRLYYPKCYNKCDIGKCNVYTEQCWCPPGRKCPTCEKDDPNNQFGHDCTLRLSPFVHKHVDNETMSDKMKEEELNCSPLFNGSFIKSGCKSKLGHKSASGLNVFVASYRDNIDWDHMKKSATSMVCKCAAAAKRLGYQTFGLQFWGECWVSKSSVHDIESVVSTQCKNAEFKECTDSDTICIGNRLSTALYSIRH